MPSHLRRRVTIPHAALRPPPILFLLAPAIAAAAPMLLDKPLLAQAPDKPPPAVEAPLVEDGGKLEPVVPDPPAAELPPAPVAPPDGVPVEAMPVAGDAPANCVIMGEASDELSLNPIAGVIITLAGTKRSVTSDANGKFRIDKLPPGNHRLEAAKLGYLSAEQVVATIEAQPAELRFSLRAKRADEADEEYTLEEETVVGEYQEDSLGGLVSELSVENSVSSGISKDDFTKTAVNDAAGAVGRIAGANIVGGKFAVVRGLADRYVTTLFNGAAISSADPSRKAVQLDIFPTTALQAIDISKTYTPDLPGDFGGGTIRIQSLSIPDERIAEFKYKIEWNTNLDNRMLVHPNRELGFWGDIDQPISDSYLWTRDEDGNPVSFNTGGNRITPGNTNSPILRQAQLNAGKAEQQQADAALPGVRALHQSQDFIPKVVKPDEGESYSLVYGDGFRFRNGNQLGFVGAFQHSSHDEVNPFGEENRLTSPARSWNEESYAREVDWAAYLAAGLKIGDQHQINATYFRKHIATDEIRHGIDYRVEGDGVFGALAKNDAVVSRYGASAVYQKEFWTIDPIVRDTELMQFNGRHKSDFGTTLSWALTSSTAREARPHTSTFQNGMLDFTDPAIAREAALDPAYIYNPALGKISTIQYQTFVNDGIGSLDSSRETQFIEEKAREGAVDITQSFFFTDDKEDGQHLDLSIGANHLEKQRQQQGRIYLLRTASWERWVARNPPAWWPSNSGIAPFSPGTPLDGNLLPDGSPLPAGYQRLGEYLADHPEMLAQYFNGYADENFGPVPGTGSGSSRANYVLPDAPYYLNGSGLEVRNIASDLTLSAMYVSGTFHGDGWRFGGGGRWEEEIKEYEVAADPLTRLLEGDPARFGSMTTKAFIPAAYGGMDVWRDKAWLNLAWSRTVARPTFHEFLPIESISQDTGIVRRGNPNLIETTIENLDASLEWTLSDALNARVSIFNKDLSDPIVVVQQVDQGVNSNTYINGDSGLIRGVEFEARWKPEHLPFSLTGNYTYIDSSLKYRVNQGIEITPLETRFPFQPSQILNLTLGWEPDQSPWSVYLTGNFTDEYPTLLRSEPSAYDVWLQPQFSLDLVIARKFQFDWFTGTLTFGVKNLASSKREYEYRGGSPGGDGGPMDGLTYTIDDPGMTYSLELKATF